MMKKSINQNADVVVVEIRKFHAIKVTVAALLLLFWFSVLSLPR